MLAVANVAEGRRCCGEGWPCSCLGGLAMGARPWTPMPELLCTYAMSSMAVDLRRCLCCTKEDVREVEGGGGVRVR